NTTLLLITHHLVLQLVDCLFSLSLARAAHRGLHSFPTRRSSDLVKAADSSTAWTSVVMRLARQDTKITRKTAITSPKGSMAKPKDRKSTRLNSSHVKISYAVFCLKKKKNYR